MTKPLESQTKITMTSTARKPPSLRLANPRAVLKNKLTNEVSLRASTARPSTQLIGGMSPEARAAMLLTREDTGDSLPRARHTSLPRANTSIYMSSSNNNNRNNNISGSTTSKRLVQHRGENTTQLRPSSRQNLQPSAASDCGSRDRSTRSRANPAVSVSDNNDSGFSSIKRLTLNSERAGASTSIRDVVTEADDWNDMDSNNNSSIIPSSNRRQRQQRPATRVSRRARHHEQSDNDSLEDGFSPGRTLTNANVKVAGRNEDDSSDDGEGSETKRGTLKEKDCPKSFVLALDAALEANCISRLRGDITDQGAGVRAGPGTVRALNGGRLSNAQEVVVNVCYGDSQKELVFHDDDDDSLDTARAASEIRVNTWLEYNQDFPPEDEHFEFDEDTGSFYDARPDITSTPQPPKAGKTTLRVPTARVKSAAKHVTNKNQSPSTSANSGGRGSKPPVGNRRDSNNNTTTNNNANTTTAAGKNNSAGSGRSKSGTTGSARDNSSSRFGSAISNDGSSKRSANSSATKRESFLARKAKQ